MTRRRPRASPRSASASSTTAYARSPSRCEAGPGPAAEDEPGTCRSTCSQDQRRAGVRSTGDRQPSGSTSRTRSSPTTASARRWRVDAIDTDLIEEPALDLYDKKLATTLPLHPWVFVFDARPTQESGLLATRGWAAPTRFGGVDSGSSKRLRHGRRGSTDNYFFNSVRSAGQPLRRLRVGSLRSSRNWIRMRARRPTTSPTRQCIGSGRVQHGCPQRRLHGVQLHVDRRASSRRERAPRRG